MSQSIALAHLCNLLFGSTSPILNVPSIMAAEIGFLSLTHLQKLPQSQSQQNSQYQHHHYYHQSHHSETTETESETPVAWMWKPKQSAQEDGHDDSWEVRAFAEDTGNIMGTTWPPRSYTCTFCRREFRSAQALGGHMNVHRRDRARLHQTPAAAAASVLTPGPNLSSSTFIIPTHEFPQNAAPSLCLLYQLPSNPNHQLFTPTPNNACAAVDSLPSSTLLSVSSCPLPPSLINASHSYSAKTQPSSSIHDTNNCCNLDHKDLGNEELDLELRLGHRSAASST